MENTPVRQYIGARYVPIFAEPAEWDNVRTYEPLTIVLHEGNSYTSRQYVPSGIDINNIEYWASTGNYNAQIEAYRQETQRAMSLAQTNKNDITDIDTILNTLNVNSTESATIARKKNETVILDIESYKDDTDIDYTNAWNKALNYAKTNKKVIIINNSISGTFELNDIQDITITGYGEFNSPLIINDTTATDQNESKITIQNMRFNVKNNHCIILKRCKGVKITKCTMKCDKNYSCIYSNETPQIGQQISRCIISENNLNGGTAIEIAPPNTDIETIGYIRWLGADLQIQNNQCVNLIRNIHLGLCDGGIITNNTLFLSLGDSDKKENIYLDVMSFSVISNNNCFEAGTNGIHITYNNVATINGNNIIWPGQYKVSSGILMEKGTANIPTSKLSYNNITNNTILKVSGHGIESKDKNFNNYSGNAIHDTGNFEHWKGETHETQPAYNIKDDGQIVGLIGNISGNSYGANTPNNTQGLELSLDNPNTPRFTPNIYTLYANTISDIDNITYSNKINLMIVNNIPTITKDQILKNIKNTPIILIFAIYGQNSTIADKKISQNTAQAALIYANNIYWL